MSNTRQATATVYNIIMYHIRNINIIIILSYLFRNFRNKNKSIFLITPVVSTQVNRSGSQTQFLGWHDHLTAVRRGVTMIEISYTVIISYSDRKIIIYVGKTLAVARVRHCFIEKRVLFAGDLSA